MCMSRRPRRSLPGIFSENWFLFKAAITLCGIASLALAQRGDLPVPADLEARLRERGYQERLLPVQADVLTPTEEETKRGWMLYRRDRNFEVLPNSRPAPNERVTKLRITAAPGEMESEPFAVYALRDVSGVKAEPAVSAQGPSAWLRDAVRVEDVLFHPVQYTVSKTGQHDEVRGASGKTYLRYPVFVRPAASYPVPAQSSRLYWVTATVNENAQPGVHRALIILADTGGNRVELPLEVEVLPFRLTERNVPRFGAFLSNAPIAKGEWAFMKRYGLD